MNILYIKVRKTYFGVYNMWISESTTKKIERKSVCTNVPGKKYLPIELLLCTVFVSFWSQWCDKKISGQMLLSCLCLKLWKAVSKTPSQFNSKFVCLLHLHIWLKWISHESHVVKFISNTLLRETQLKSFTWISHESKFHMHLIWKFSDEFQLNYTKKNKRIFFMFLI